MARGRSLPAASALAAALVIVSGYNLGRVNTAAKALEYSDVPPECTTVMRGPGVPTFKVRDDLGTIVQSEGLARGVELGVQHGYFSRAMLSRWPNCTEYHLVDLWSPQENYDDVANVDQAKQDEIYNGAMERLAPWKEKLRVCRNYTTICADEYEDKFFDFIYVDARHDYKGVWEDVTKWWHKLRVGGIMAGHDYITQSELGVGWQNWTINYDGTVDHTGTVVKGAVDTFAKSVCRQVTVSYREQSFNTWAIRK